MSVAQSLTTHPQRGRHQGRQNIRHALIHYASAFGLALCFFYVHASAEEQSKVTEGSVSKHIHGFEGSWRFDKEDFSKRHPFYMDWMVRKALNTRLVLSSEFFIQYRSPGQLHKSKRSIIEVEKLEQGWRLTRKEGDAHITMTLTLENDRWIYREADMEYQLHRDHPEEWQRWLSGAKSNG